MCVPVLTPDREKKDRTAEGLKTMESRCLRLQGRTDTESELKLQGFCGMLDGIRKENSKDYEAGKIDISRHKFLESEIREDGIVNTLSTVQKDNLLAVKVREGKEKDGLFVKISDVLTVYAVWYEKYQCYIAIRKLTPRECFRLQGWSDEYFDRAELDKQ